MCGIFGYIGTKNIAAQIILGGLKTLEYRGYDSWGIAVKNRDRIDVDKHVGKIGQAKTILPAATTGIGHTRWATHGGVTSLNSHPHLSCDKRFAVVHNGIVENYEPLKEFLVKKGHVFVSETDTEIIPHLIEEFAKKHNTEDAVRLSFNSLHGLSGIVVLDTQANTIIAAKTGSPLVVGIGKNEFILASDLSAITSHTKQVLFLKDNEMVILNGKLSLYSLPFGKAIKPTIETVNFSQEEGVLGNYKHFMLKEIADQPKVIINIAVNYREEAGKLATAIKNAKGTFFIAAGTAYNACLAGIYLFSRVSGIHVNSAIASEFNYLEHFLNKDSLVMALSQSGETIDVIEPLSRAREKGATIAALVNSLGSTIYRMADVKVLLAAGPEKSVASTKAYTAKVAALLLVSYALVNRESEIIPKLKQAALEIKKMLEKENISKIKKLAGKLKNAQTIFIIGRGISYASALEGALKIKEVTYIHTEGLAGGELKHGTIALIQKGTPCIVFAPNDETHDAMISNATEIKARGGYIIGVSHKNENIFDYWVEVKDVKDATVLTQIVPIQLLAYYLALKRGITDPDKPRNLAKSVTVK